MSFDNIRIGGDICLITDLAKGMLLVLIDMISIIYIGQQVSKII